MGIARNGSSRKQLACWKKGVLFFPNLAFEFRPLWWIAIHTLPLTTRRRDMALVFNVVNIDMTQFAGCLWNEPHIKIESLTQ
jgi:hypothetical protein